MSGDLAKVESGGGQLSVAQVKGRLDGIQELMKSTMENGTDYGKIPGTNSKPTLLKPGAEKLSVMFQLDPEYETTETWHDDGHLTVKTYCTIYHAPTTMRLGGASALCSTREAKYAYRKGERVCPNCGMANIRKSKQGDGYYCWAKMGGCGATFPNGDDSIESQQVGRTANPDLADSYHSVMRIAEKRSFIAAVRQVTSASAIFDEEIPAAEPDHAEADAPPARDTRRPSPPPQQQAAQQQPQRPPVDRRAVAETACKVVAAADSLAALEAYCKNPPLPRNFLIKDEHTAAIYAAIDRRKLELCGDEIDRLCEELALDTVKLAMLGQKVGVSDIDAMSGADAMKLLEALRAEAAEGVPV